MDHLLKSVESAIAAATGQPFRVTGRQSRGGGCIHEAARITGADGRAFFVKSNAAALLPAFEAEAEALRAIAATRTIRVPLPVATCAEVGRAALILEYLPMDGGRRDWAALGRQLALLHRHTSPRFGWPRDNWLGATPQSNAWRDDAAAFIRECRLAPQIRMARENGLALPRAEALLEALPSFYTGYRPVASLLHGDLWAGNAGFLADGTPVVFDPASHHGDREADLAMTELFGGFPREFYSAYAAEWPLEPGYPTRKHLHSLYHLLNHHNLFGGGYGAQARACIDRLLDSLPGN